MFDTGEGAFFTFVKNPNPNFLGVDLSSTEADDADNIQYKTTDGTLEVTSGFLKVVQRQGSAALKMRLSAFNMAGSPQSTAFVSAVTGAKPAVNITEVRVNGTVVFTGSQASVEVDIAAGATVSLEDGQRPRRRAGRRRQRQVRHRWIRSHDHQPDARPEAPQRSQTATATSPRPASQSASTVPARSTTASSAA